MTTHQMAATIVALVEKYLGAGFDPVTDVVLVEAVAEYLEEEAPAAARPQPLAALDLDCPV